jgi:hypothetical protein
MITTSIFSLIFLIIGLILGYLLGVGRNVPLPSIRPPQALTAALTQRKNRITGRTGAVKPLSPKDLAERKEVKALMEFKENEEPL